MVLHLHNGQGRAKLWPVQLTFYVDMFDGKCPRPVYLLEHQIHSGRQWQLLQYRDLALGDHLQLHLFQRLMS